MGFSAANFSAASEKVLVVTKYPLWLLVWWIVPRDFLQHQRADDRLFVIFALDDSPQAVAAAAEPEVGPFVSRAADALDLEVHHLEQLGNELFRS